MKICRFCGKEISDDAMFCRYCGNKQEDMSGHPGSNPAGAANGPEDGIVCPRCGTINSESAQACLNCGASLSIPQLMDGASMNGTSMNTAPAESQDKNTKHEKSKKWLWGGLALASLLLFLAAGTLFAFIRLTGSAKGFDLSKAELVENYVKPTGDGTVDLAARDRQPSARNLAGKWNSQIFYWLEDVGGEDDNHIADCRLTRMELTRQDNGKVLEYEVYRDPGTDEIYKIVSIETLEDGSLEISDYYYQNGKPNFVFRRNDSVYTPSYASIDKVGERYYFSDDQMVKWRWIYEPSVVKQWILELEDTWYTQWAYGDISDGERAEYDDKERQVLNEAYHTYEAVTANPKVTLIEGRVLDENGSPLEGVEVGIGKIESDDRKAQTAKAKNPEIKLLTDEDGQYAWAVDDTKAEYFLVFQKKGWIEAVMEPSLIPEAFVQAPQDDLILLAERKEKTSPVTFLAYRIEPQDEETAAEDESAENEAIPLADASVTVYAGLNYTLEAPAAENKTDAEGKLSLDLSPGIYTAEINKDGVSSANQVFLADGSEKEVVVYTIAETSDSLSGDGPAEPDNDTWSILLTWENPDGSSLDLDSSLFTPDKAAMGDRNCVNTLNRSDGGGARFLYDGSEKSAYETITLTAPKKGSYKYYVTNYTDILSGNPSSDRMSAANAKVTLCRNNIPVKTFMIPDKKGAVWEVFELRNQQVVPIQEVYENVQGKSWWTEDKHLARISEDYIRAGWIQSDGEWLYFANPADDNKLYYCRKDGSGLTKFCDDQLLNNHILLVDNQVYYTYSGRFNYIARVNTDGSGRELLTDSMDLSELYDEDGNISSLDIKGYKNGVLYYYHAPETIGGICGLSLTDRTQKFTQYSCQGMVTVGNYLYYIGKTSDQLFSPGASFYRETLDGAQCKCLQPSISWYSCPDWTIYKGWLYYCPYGTSEIRCMRLDGSGDMLLASNGLEWHNQIILQNDYCYYIGGDRQIYRLDINNPIPSPLSIFGDRLAILDGEIYARDASSKWSPIMVCDREGQNLRPLFDTGASRQAGAMRAYAELLDGYVPSFYSYEYGGDIKFACQDIDNDGVNELFVQAPSIANPYLFVSYFRYEDSLKQIWDGMESGLTMAVNPNAGEITIYWVARNDYIDRYRSDGSLLENLAFYPGQAPDSDAETAAFNRAYNTYIKPYPHLNFVVNTPANRQQYLINGTGTGWTYE